MPSPLSIYLVRHGESAANLDKTLNATLADHVVPLSSAGPEQARAAGVELARHLAEEPEARGTVGVYVSPYLRTRQTWEHVREGMASVREEWAALAATESIFLRELEFGLFDGVPDDELPERFPIEYRHYEKLKAAQGEFYARMPSGESRCDVAQRVHQFFGTLHRDRERHGLEHAVVVSHGVTIRAFAMQWLGLPVEWMERERNPLNCSVRWLRDGADRGLIHEGAPHAPRTTQDRREEGQVEPE